LNNSKILGEGSYQISPESLNKFKILGGGSSHTRYQTPSENSNNPRIPEESFHTSLVNSIFVGCKEESNQTSLYTTRSKGVKRKELLSRKN